MSLKRTSRLIRFTPFRILIPMVLMILLFAGSVFFFLLPSIQTTFLNYKKETIFELTGSVMTTLSHLHDKEKQGRMTRKQAQALARSIIGSQRYGPEAKDYFWISDTSNRMLMHPYRHDLEGQDLTDFRDTHGKAVFLEFSKAVKEKGGGFVNYYWQWKDKPDKIVRKLSYVREFKPWGWIVGTGIYLDDVQKEITSYRNMVGAIFVTILMIIAVLQFYIMRQAALSEEKKAKIMDQRERLVHALQQGEERYRTIADFAYDWEIWFGVAGEVLYCSPSCERMTGYAPELFFERPELIRDIVISEDRQAWDNYLVRADKEGGDTLDFRIYTQKGDLRWLNVVGRSVSGINMKPLGIRCSFRDITDRKQMENQLRHQALHDPLTGLANRTLCLDRIKHTMQRARRNEKYYFAVAFLDLDRFKVINDSLGHHFGDMVLLETGNRLAEHVRTLDTISRFGGDEFVMLLDDLTSPGEALRIIKRVREALSRPFRFNESEVQTTASVGIVLSPIGDSSPAEILQYANIAMHRAKEAGRNRFKVFTSRMLEVAVDQLSMENDMRRGLDSGEFYVEYQPIMDLEGSTIMGVEALARWNHPEKGLVTPSEFIPLAEENGTILQLGEWVLRASLKELAELRKHVPDSEDLFMSVNISSKQFARLDLDQVVLDALRQADLPPDCLKLEITESTILEHPEAAVRVLQKLRDKGVRFSIDDFGTGYSSLAQLQRLPVDTLKVDRSFISRMQTNPEHMEIVKAVIALAHSLDLDVVAEGVEEPDQLCALLDLRCERVQGFYFHKPLGADELLQLLRKGMSNGEDSPKEIVARARRECERKGE